MTKQDLEHLQWIHDRMIAVHNENPNYDYMLYLQDIINRQLGLTVDHHKQKYTDKDFFSVIYAFHTSEDRREKAIADKVGVKEGYVCKVLTDYFDKRMNLGELAIESKDMDSFVGICINV